MALRCKKCNCVISIDEGKYIPFWPTPYYCQGCGEHKQSYEIYEVEE